MQSLSKWHGFNRKVWHGQTEIAKYEGYEFFDYDYPPEETKTFTDSRDDQTYKYVKIGNHYWMSENLNYDAGSGSWGYNNNSSNATDNYGRLYDWETACDVCPNGWHLPSNAEWEKLINHIGGESVAGGNLKETGTKHWSSPNEGATNKTGFSALPGGYRYKNGYFSNMGEYGLWWSSTEFSSSSAWYRGLRYDTSYIYWDYDFKECGFSVRCVRD